MIKYKEIQSSSLSGYVELFDLRRLLPIKITYNKKGTDVIYGNIYYTIPNLNTKFGGFWYHKEDGPAIIEDSLPTYYYYGRSAKDEKQFYDSNWRKQIEIEKFL